MPKMFETNVLLDRADRDKGSLSGVLDLRRRERLGEGELEGVLDRWKERLEREEGELGGVLGSVEGRRVIESISSGGRALLLGAARLDRDRGATMCEAHGPGGEDSTSKVNMCL